MKSSKLSKTPILILILVISAFFRLYNLTTLPISLFGDEIDVGYHAWSLITTGRDYMGHILPTYIQSLSEWRTPLLSYFIAPFTLLGGSNVLISRLPVALLGILNIYLIFLLTRSFFNKNIALLSALILAITPWHIHFSRIAIDSTLLLTLLLAGTLFFITKRYTLFILSFILTFYTYSTANLFSPLLVLSLIFIYKQRNIVKKIAKKSYLLIFLIPIAYHLTLGQATGRFKQISIFSDKKIVYDIVNQRTSIWSDQNSWQEKFFHNKIISYSGKIASNYISALSPQFLFISGDPNFRHSIGRFGELLWVSAPFLLIGFANLIRYLHRRNNKLILMWLLIAPLPSSLTADGAMHATRLILLLPPLTILTALGIDYIFTSINSKKLFFLASFLLAIASFLNISAYWYRYTAHYKFESARHWQDGYQDIFSKTLPYLNKADKIYINNTYEPSLLKFAFFTHYPAQKFQEDFISDRSQDNIVAGFDGFRFSDKYYFGQAKTLGDLFSLLDTNDLYVAVQGQEVPGDWNWKIDPPLEIEVLETTLDSFGNPLFYLIRKK